MAVGVVKAAGHEETKQRKPGGLGKELFLPGCSRLGDFVQLIKKQQCKQNCGQCHGDSELGRHLNQVIVKVTMIGGHGIGMGKVAAIKLLNPARPHSSPRVLADHMNAIAPHQEAILRPRIAWVKKSHISA